MAWCPMVSSRQAAMPCPVLAPRGAPSRLTCRYWVFRER